MKLNYESIAKRLLDLPAEDAVMGCVEDPSLLTGLCQYIVSLAALSSEDEGRSGPPGESEWGWMQTHSDRAYGPFDSREEAVAAADAHNYSPNDGIVFGRCAWADPASVLPSMDEFVEKLDEAAYNNDFSFWEDEVFDVRNPDEARKEFDAMLRAWADKYLAANVWQLIPETPADAAKGDK